mmetsp:Transcript_19959/g.20071  ORF Transcript_19959/g.20071 Transcript_19959/m.20071 type:complete len:240 (-) Transcript_19959:262-981(-)
MIALGYVSCCWRVSCKNIMLTRRNKIVSLLIQQPYGLYSNSARNFNKLHDKEHQLSGENQENKALGATILGAGVNFSLAILKGVAGSYVGSTALIADGINNLGDLVTDAVVYYCITIARKKPSLERPWGNGKIEPLGALAVGSLVVVTGAGIGYTSLLSFSEMISSEHAQTPSKEVAEYMQYAAISISLVAILSKEALFHYTYNAGIKSNSASVVANAWQHRADGLISGAALTGFLGDL